MLASLQTVGVGLLEALDTLPLLKTLAEALGERCRVVRDQGDCICLVGPFLHTHFCH